KSWGKIKNASAETTAGAIGGQEIETGQEEQDARVRQEAEPKRSLIGKLKEKVWPPIVVRDLIDHYRTCWKAPKVREEVTRKIEINTNELNDELEQEKTFKKERDKTTNELTKLKEKLGDALTAKSQTEIQKGIDNLEQKIIDAESKSEKLRKKIEKIKTSQLKFEAKIEHSCKRISAKLQRKIDRNQRVIDKKKEDVTKRQEQFDKNRETINELEEVKREITQHLQSGEVTNIVKPVLEKQLANISDRAEKLKNQNIQLQDQNSRLQDKVNILRGKNTTLGSKQKEIYPAGFKEATLQETEAEEEDEEDTEETAEEGDAEEMIEGQEADKEETEQNEQESTVEDEEQEQIETKETEDEELTVPHFFQNKEARASSPKVPEVKIDNTRELEGIMTKWNQWTKDKKEESLAIQSESFRRFLNESGGTVFSAPTLKDAVEKDEALRLLQDYFTDQVKDKAELPDIKNLAEDFIESYYA
ncbi:MAG: hypothetical protein KKF39_04820, partial [Nanoarchaeota archaeon]|nr:hypothetical protein [Nanoarchaeota archaeon]